MKKTLYILEDQTRFFLLPDDAPEPPFGDLGVRTVLGKRRFFDAAALSAYEVPREEAHAHSKAAIERFFSAARDSFTASTATGPAPVPSEAVRRDVEAFMSELRALMTGLRRALTDKPDENA